MTQPNSNTPIYQRRRYQVSADKRAAFHTHFEKHALRIMLRYDFKPVAIRESAGTTTFDFIYIFE